MPNQNSDIRENLVKYASFVLNRRPYFRHTLKQKLQLRCQKLKFADSTSVIDSIIDDLAKSGYLNDGYLAEAFVRRQLSKGYGPSFIKLKLNMLKLPTDTINNALEKEADFKAQMESARQFISKKGISEPKKAVYTLFKRGFGSNITRKLFDWEPEGE